MVGSDVDKFCEDSCDGLRSHEAWGKCLRVLNGKSMRRALELAASAETKDAQSRIPLLSRLFQIRRTVKHFILVSTESSSFENLSNGFHFTMWVIFACIFKRLLSRHQTDSHPSKYKTRLHPVSCPDPCCWYFNYCDDHLYFTSQITESIVQCCATLYLKRPLALTPTFSSDFHSIWFVIYNPVCIVGQCFRLWVTLNE